MCALRPVTCAWKRVSMNDFVSLRGHIFVRGAVRLRSLTLVVSSASFCAPLFPGSGKRVPVRGAPDVLGASSCALPKCVPAWVAMNGRRIWSCACGYMWASWYSPIGTPPERQQMLSAHNATHAPFLAIQVDQLAAELVGSEEPSKPLASLPLALRCAKIRHDLLQWVLAVMATASINLLQQKACTHQHMLLPMGATIAHACLASNMCDMQNYQSTRATCKHKALSPSPCLPSTEGSHASCPTCWLHFFLPWHAYSESLCHHRPVHAWPSCPLPVPK